MSRYAAVICSPDIGAGAVSAPDGSRICRGLPLFAGSASVGWALDAAFM
jgi:hypothetical protein